MHNSKANIPNMDKETFVEDSPASLHRPREDDFFNDREAGMVAVDMDRIEKVYR